MTETTFEILSLKLSSHVTTSSALILSLLDNPARPNSGASKSIAERGSVPQIDMLKVNHDILQAARGAYDHLNAFAATLLSRNQGGWAYGSLARSSVEHFARAHFLLQASSPVDRYYRYMRSRIRAVSFLANEQYRTYAAEWGVNAKEKEAEWTAELEALGGKGTYPNSQISPPILAKALLRLTDEELAGTADRSAAFYAMMASLSHGERPGTEYLINPDLHTDHALVLHPPGLTVDLEQFLAPVLFVKVKSMLALWAYFGVSTEESRAWGDECMDIAKYANGIWHKSETQREGA
ncbi:hypothetical protein [Clavibacter michiganensis]|uniref:hypothetical protein n=1 Tax=Clavibacter michiganensis TaxID=28447 RepID=UPI0026DCA783|nr:hypothetical protein [Clavibacter michiganensis]MDO4027624.1 hypothetical protein [Clavibacter michiganensis]